MRCLSYAPDANFTDDFLLHFSGYVWWGVFHTLLLLALLRSFFYTPGGSFSVEFLLHSLGMFGEDFLPSYTPVA